MMTASKRLGILALLLALWLVGVGANCHAGEQAYLGVVLQPLTVDIKEAMDVDRDLRGVLISDVVEESPADDFGLEDGDIILEIDGKEITTVSGATRVIKGYSPGDEVKIVVMRDGDKRAVVSVKLGERRDSKVRDEDYDFDFDIDIPDIKHKMIKSWGDRAYLGVRIQGLSSDLGDYFGVDEGEGVLVLEVVDDSPAEDAGLKPGDVILEIDGEEMEDASDLVEYIGEQEPGDDIEITFKRKRRTRTLEVELGEQESPFEETGEWLDKSGGKRRIRIRTEPGEMGFKTYKVPGKHGDVRIITIPDKDAVLEELEDIHIDEIDMDDLREEMENLKKELHELQKELQKLKD
jgi:membrane-associated protease RseP (regulator of RpoE activity)